MKIATIAILLVAAGWAATAAPAAHSAAHAEAAAQGRAIVQVMLGAMDRQDRRTFDRVVEKRGIIDFGDRTEPLRLRMLPVGRVCNNPTVSTVEPSTEIAGDSKVTVSWSCKSGNAVSNSKLVVRFWVHGGKVIYGERV